LALNCQTGNLKSLQVLDTPVSLVQASPRGSFDRLLEQRAKILATDLQSKCNQNRRPCSFYGSAGGGGDGNLVSLAPDAVFAPIQLQRVLHRACQLKVELKHEAV